MTSQQGCVGSTGFFTSSGEEDRRSKHLGAQNKEPRARIEALERKGGEGALGGQGNAFHPAEKVAWRKHGEWTWTWRRR